LSELVLLVRPMAEDVMELLEGKGLIQRLSPTENVLLTPENEVGVDYTYSTDPKFGPHMLICVGFNKSVVDLAYHSDKEDFILINEGRQQKPLILLVGLHKAKEFQELVSTNGLTQDDILALDLKFNDPSLSFFTMNGFTPHCEWTTPGNGPASVFYVTEPRDLDANHIHMGDYTIKINYGL
jgi:hypothetical protein